MRRTVVRVTSTLVAIIVFHNGLMAQGTASGVSTPAGEAREALARAHLRMDRAYAIADSLGRITDSTRMRVNRTFDRATFSFFGGRFAAAVAAIDSSVQQLAIASGVPSPPVTAVPTISAFPGDSQRSLRVRDDLIIPMRVVAAPALVASKRPLGVLLALHGAGGDENMFVDAYGQGIAARLAAEQGLVLVSPTTTPFVQSAERFDSLLVVLRREYRIDTTWVFVMGHSMGASAGAARLAEALRAADGATATERIAAMGQTYVAFADAHPGLFSLMFQPVDATARPETLPIAARTLDLLREGIRDVTGRDDPVDVATLWALVHGLSALRANSHQLFADPAMIREVTQRVAQALPPREPLTL